jgi:REP element-mobilizing transposase RayT
MTSHAHMIISSNGLNRLDYIIRDTKSFTSRHIRKELEQGQGESRKGWMLPMFYQAGRENSNNNDFQFWIQSNHPVMMATEEMFLQRLNYIHYNPVEAGFVTEPEHWKWSSAYDYIGGKQGLLDLVMVV